MSVKFYDRRLLGRSANTQYTTTDSRQTLNGETVRCQYVRNFDVASGRWDDTRQSSDPMKHDGALPPTPTGRLSTCSSSNVWSDLRHGSQYSALCTAAAAAAAAATPTRRRLRPTPIDSSPVLSVRLCLQVGFPTSSAAKSDDRNFITRR